MHSIPLATIKQANAVVSFPGWPTREEVPTLEEVLIETRGLGPFTWTVNEESEMRRVIDCGVLGIVTDYPDRLRAIMDDIEQSATPSSVRLRN